MFGKNKTNIEADLLRGQIRDRLTTTEDDIRKLQTAQKHIELEWTELYDKVQHAMSRISKRAERAAKAAEVEAPDFNGEDPAEGTQFVDPISAKILARRQNRGIAR